MNMILDLVQSAVALERRPLRPVADDQQMHSVANALKLVRSPDQLLDSLLRPESANRADEPRVGRQPEFRQQCTTLDRTCYGWRHAVGNHGKFLRRQPAADIKLADRGAVNDNPLRPPGQKTIDRQF